MAEENSVAVITSDPISTTDSGLKLYLRIRVLSQDLKTNSSNVRIAVLATRTDSKTTSLKSFSLDGYVSSKTSTSDLDEYGAGSDANFTTRTIKKGTNTVIWRNDSDSGDNGVKFTHDKVGSKTITMSLTTFKANSTTILNKTKSGAPSISLVIPDLGTASTISSISGNSTLGTSGTLSVAMNASQIGFTHKLMFKIGNTSYTLNAGSASKRYTDFTYAHTLQETLMKEFKTETSMTMTVVLYTYRNGTLVGSSYKNHTVSISNSIGPSITVNSSSAYATKNVWRVDDIKGTIAKYGESGTVPDDGETLIIGGKTLFKYDISIGHAKTYDMSPIKTITIRDSKNVYYSCQYTMTDNKLVVQLASSFTVKSTYASPLYISVTNFRGKTITKTLLSDINYDYTSPSATITKIEKINNSLKITFKYHGCTFGDKEHVHNFVEFYLYGHDRTEANDNRWKSYDNNVMKLYENGMGTHFGNDDSLSYSTSSNGNTYSVTLDASNFDNSDLDSYDFKVLYCDSFSCGESNTLSYINKATFLNFNADSQSIGIGGKASIVNDNSVTIADGWGLYLPTGDYTPSSSSGDALYMNTTTGLICKLSSALRYKDDVNYDIDKEKIHEIVSNFKPVTFKYKNSNDVEYGLIADDLDKLDNKLVVYNQDGSVENFRDRGILAMLIVEIQRQNAIIESLYKKLEDKENKEDE
jgi:hypothetical protein